MRAALTLHGEEELHTLYARHPLERVGLEKSKNCQKGGVQRIFSIKGVLIKRVWQKKKKKGGVAYPN